MKWNKDEIVADVIEAKFSDMLTRLEKLLLRCSCEREQICPLQVNFFQDK